MIKYLIFISAKKGISREEFRKYYETRHAPLSQRLFPMCTDYRRNYFDPAKDVVRGQGFDFDVVTEMWFETEGAFQEFQKKVQEPDVIAQVLADEKNFMDPDSVRIVVVDEQRSPHTGYRPT